MSLPSSMNPVDLDGAAPYIQIVILGALAWLVREIVLRQGMEQTQRARSVLLDRLERAYGPMYFIVGEITAGVLAGESVPKARLEELRAVLRVYGHHLREEHYRFCTDLLMGRRPSAVDVAWHRRSVHRELGKLRYLLYGPPSEFEVALSPRPMTVLWRLASRFASYALAFGLWLFIFAILIWLALGSIARAPERLAVVLVGLLVLRGIQEAIRARSFRRHFAPVVLRRMKRGSKGPDVELLQIILAQCGNSVGPAGIDGVFGRDTEEAVRRHQQATGLTATGIVDRKTRASLYRAARSLVARPAELSIDY